MHQRFKTYEERRKPHLDGSESTDPAFNVVISRMTSLHVQCSFDYPNGALWLGFFFLVAFNDKALHETR
jgi:hypothetical protein